MPLDARVGIEIKDVPIGLFEVLFCRAPCVQLKSSDLRESNQASRIIDDSIMIAFFFLLDEREPNLVRSACSGVFLVKASRLQTIWAPNKH